MTKTSKNTSKYLCYKSHIEVGLCYDIFIKNSKGVVKKK